MASAASPRASATRPRPTYASAEPGLASGGGATAALHRVLVGLLQEARKAPQARPVEEDVVRPGIDFESSREVLLGEAPVPLPPTDLGARPERGGACGTDGEEAIDLRESPSLGRRVSRAGQRGDPVEVRSEAPLVEPAEPDPGRAPEGEEDGHRHGGRKQTASGPPPEPGEGGRSASRAVARQPPPLRHFRRLRTRRVVPLASAMFHWPAETERIPYTTFTIN